MKKTFDYEQTFHAIVRYGKVIVLCLLVAMEIVAGFNFRYIGAFNGLWVVIPVEVVLTAENAFKMWGAKSFKPKVACYVLDTLCLMLLTYFTKGSYISTLYVIILTEFYITQERLSHSIAMGVSSVVLFLAIFAVSNALRGEGVNFVELFSSLFNDLLLFVMHFFIVNFTLQIYRKNREIAHTLDELNEKNEKLREADAELRNVALLEERQRIAKDIHDTAGHSITTVIMQTEAAKLVIDDDPEAAKRKLFAANLQAKHALEELRESVHLLSGFEQNQLLKDALLRIIHESTDGTDISIRYDIADLNLCAAKYRFLCNSLKEGISNGLRHGGATAFWFELKAEGGKVCFLLSDNGSGADLRHPAEGFGLSGMRKRAENLGGEARFESEPGEGFEIHITLPADENGKGGKS